MQQISRKFKSEAMTNAKMPHSNVVQGFVEVARMDSFSYDLTYKATSSQENQ